MTSAFFSRNDDVSQQLAALSLMLSSLRRRVGEHDHPPLETALMDLQQRTKDLVESVRRISHDLHPGILQQVGLHAALESHCAEFQEQHGIEVTFRGEAHLSAIPRDAALCLFRAAQEALQNVAKHAAARRARVVLARERDELTLTVVDDGRGFDTTRVQRTGGGLGLLSIEERARLLHGSIRTDTGAGRGTTGESRSRRRPRAADSGVRRSPLLPTCRFRPSGRSANSRYTNESERVVQPDDRRQLAAKA